MKRKKDGGFTLIELMIVIAVIGILAVVLVPKMSSVKDSAKVAGVTTNVKSVESLITANINQWAQTTATPGTIATAVFQNFSGNNAISNPFTTSTAVTQGTGVSGYTTPGGSTSIPANASGDAIQIVTAAPSTTGGSVGTVVVYVYSGFPASGGITVAGYDNKGNIINSQTINP